MSRESLVEKTMKELRDVAKNLNIQGRWDMSKQQIIDAISKVEETSENDSSQKENDVEKKASYVDKAEVGVLIAFNDVDAGRIRTAKLVKKSTKRRVVKAETEYGKSFIIPFENIIWVKTGARWPRGIYEELKRGKVNEKV